MGYLKPLQYIYYREKVDFRFLIRLELPGPPCAPVTDIIVEFNSPASPVPVSFGSVRSE